MNFKTKVAYSAVLATLGMAAGSAQAAYLSEGGLGEVLIYPYYTVQNGFDTYVSVVNTTNTAKAVKVRFIEGKASQEVLDFNLYLSAYDVWAGAVTASTEGAKLVTNDKSCTAPQITGAVEFRNLAYAGKDSFEDGLSRTREGYIEIIEMGDLGQPIAPVTGITTGNAAWRITHSTTTGLPNDCPWVTAQWAASSSAGLPGGTLAVTQPTGGLVGSATLINVAQGVDYSYDPTAIEDFSTATTLHTTPGSTSPSLNNADVTSVVINQNALGAREVVTTPNWIAGRFAVDAVLMRDNVINEYTVETALNAGTDWVVTFPTKRLHVTADAFEAPFTKRFGTLTASPWYEKGKWAACEDVAMSIYDREERTKGGGIDFSPSTSPVPQLCYEANVITFKNTKVLGSLNLEKNVSDVFDNGWMRLDLYNNATPDHRIIAGVGSNVNGTAVTGITYTGLPVAGFAVQKYVNGSVGGVLSNYGGSFAHKYTRNLIIVP